MSTCLRARSPTRALRARPLILPTLPAGALASLARQGLVQSGSDARGLGSDGDIAPGPPATGTALVPGRHPRSHLRRSGGPRQGRSTRRVRARGTSRGARRAARAADARGRPGALTRGATEGRPSRRTSKNASARKGHQGYVTATRKEMRSLIQQRVHLSLTSRKPCLAKGNGVAASLHCH